MPIVATTGAQHSAELAERLTQEFNARKVNRKRALGEFEEERQSKTKPAEVKGKIWFVHGTESTRLMWVQDYAAFTGRVAYFFGMPYELFEWGKHNNDSFSRFRAAYKLATTIKAWHKSHPNAPIILVSHSHGGNVCILAANILGNPKAGVPIFINNLITISAPVRPDYQLQFDNVINHNQIYNIYDEVQVNAGFDKNLANLPNWIKNGKIPMHLLIFPVGNIKIGEVPLKEISVKMFPPGGGGREKEYGRADRCFPPPANNIKVDVINKTRFPLQGIDAHSAVMHNDSIWIKLVEPYLQYTIRYIEASGML